MRALIVLCSVLVVALAVLIIIYVGQHSGAQSRVGPKFQVSELVQDARPGEFAVYREKGSGRRLRFVVVERPETTGLGVPYLVIRRDRLCETLSLTTQSTGDRIIPGPPTKCTGLASPDSPERWRPSRAGAGRPA